MNNRVKNIKIKNGYYKVLAKGIKLVRPFELIELNKAPMVTEPTIFVLNHSSMYDVPVAMEYLKQQVSLLSGKENLDIKAKLMFSLADPIYVDRINRESRNAAYIESVRKIKSGKNLLEFSEVTWNLTREIMLSMYWGAVKASIETGSPIIPIILEYSLDKCFAKTGQEIKLSEDMSLQKGLSLLAESLINLRLDAWEVMGPDARINLSEEDFNRYIEQRLNEYPKYDRDFEESLILKESVDLDIDYNNINERLEKIKKLKR